MSRLDAPKDPNLTPIWNHAVLWALFLGLDPYEDENVRPYYNQFLEMTPPVMPTPYQFPIEGYVLRKATVEDIPLLARTLAKEGNHTEENSHKFLGHTITDPWSWCFIWEYKGEPLQYESFSLGLNGMCYGGHTIHLDHSRPHWVWRESQRPVWEALAANGYYTVISSLRKDRAYWMPQTLEMYNGKFLYETKTGHLRLEYDTRNTVFQGWPERKTLGADWEYTEGEFTLKESTDYEAIKAYLTEQWKGRSRIKLILEMLDRWWNLDKASMLVGYRSGNLEYVRLARHRSKGVNANMGALTRVKPDQEAFTRGFFEWMRKVGYTTATYFVPEKDYNVTQGYAELMPKYHGKIVGSRKWPNNLFYEIRYDLVAQGADK